MRRAIGWALGLALAGGCGEGLPEISLKLSKNCNEVQVDRLAPSVGAGAGDQVLDMAADGALSPTAWVLVRRLGADGEAEVVVQQVDAEGVVHEEFLPRDAAALDPSTLSLEAAPQVGQVWVVHDEPGSFELWRIAPDDPLESVRGSEDMADFPSDGPLCDPCDNALWPRELLFMDGKPALASLPPFSVDAGLVVWVGVLDTDGYEIRMTNEHRLNFEPPCEDESPEGMSFCEDQRETLHYPEVSVLGKQADPRLSQTVFFGHRTRSQTFGGEEFPIESADIFMVALFIDDKGVPAGVLRSYSGIYTPDNGPLDGSAPPLPSASPPFGVAIDRFASYGLFNNGAVLPRIVQLPDVDPDFVELTDRVPLSLDTQLLQLDRDLALGRLEGGQWELTKLFPDQPSQSKVTVYTTDAPIREVVTGGMGTFMLRKDGAPPELVRVRCTASEDEATTEPEP